MIKKILVLTIAALILISLCACRKKDRLIGKWTMTLGDFTISREFKEDGTVVERSNSYPKFRVEGVYKVDGNKIYLTMTDFINNETNEVMRDKVEWEFTYRFKDGDLLLLDIGHNNDEEAVYVRE